MFVTNISILTLMFIREGGEGGPFGKNTWLRKYMYIDIILLDNI